MSRKIYNTVTPGSFTAVLYINWKTVISLCKAKAKENGYYLTIETYGQEGYRDARVILDMDFVFPVIQVTRRYTIEGYAR